MANSAPLIVNESLSYYYGLLPLYTITLVVAFVCATMSLCCMSRYFDPARGWIAWLRGAYLFLCM